MNDTRTSRPRQPYLLGSIPTTVAIALAALAFALANFLGGCGFVEEGTPSENDTSHHRAPRPDGTQIPIDSDGPDISSSTTPEDSTGHAVEGSSDDDGENSSSTGAASEDASTDEGASSSESTGDFAGEPHCDAGCPEADRLMNADAGTACVCAPSCETDDDCEGLALCNSTGVAGEGRCYIECDAPAQCPLDPPMTCRYYQGSISACMWDGES